MHKPRKTGVGHNKQFGKFVFTIFERRHLIMFFSYFQISGSVEWASNYYFYVFGSRIVLISEMFDVF